MTKLSFGSFLCVLQPVVVWIVVEVFKMVVIVKGETEEGVVVVVEEGGKEGGSSDHCHCHQL